MVGAFVVAATCLTPTAAVAQCTPSESVNAALFNYVDGSANLIDADAATWTKPSRIGLCWGGYWRTELWYVGISNFVYNTLMCSTYGGATGGFSQGACYAISYNTLHDWPAGLAGVHAAIFKYGCAATHSRHWNVNGAWTWVGEAGGNSCSQDPPPPPDSSCSWDPEIEDYYCPSPIILPTGKHALRKEREDYDLTDVDRGVSFDLDGDGVDERTSWTSHNSDIGFLSLDRNGNGKIDNGKELFGNFTHPGKSNGFAALRVDAGNVGLVEEGHPLYRKLLLWTDRNQNGLSESDELEPFSTLYSSISLAYDVSALRDKHGNRFLYRGNATIRTGAGLNRQRDPQENEARVIDIYDVFFVTR